MKKISRLLAVTAAAAISVVAGAAFAGCSTNYPEVTIVYEFNGTEYDVTYTLTRKGAPQTVQHFIELADAGYYDGTVIHDYASGGLFLYGGGYTWNPDAADLEDRLVEKDYWTEIKALEEKGNTFTQTVYKIGHEEPLYTVHGEFADNGVKGNTKSYSHSQGALVMYYSNKGSDNTPVGTVRTDGGKGNDGNDYDEGDIYKYNSATSLFYTYTSPNANNALGDSYAVFGKTKDYSQLQALLDAINSYTNDLGEGKSFTETSNVLLNQYDPFELVRSAKIWDEFDVPVEPITIKTVTVDKY